ncbi:hypothetical protein D5272_10375 [bacterium D16-76]|nr:hypothetical protein [bacterium D16-76]
MFPTHPQHKTSTWPRALAALLLAVLVLLAGSPQAALAADGDNPGITADDPLLGGEGDFTPDPPDTPTPVPPDIPSSDPGVPSEPPVSSWGSSSDDPSSEEPDNPSEPPPVYSEPPREEDPKESSSHSAGPVVTPRPTPRSGGSTISQPNLGRPKLTFNSSSSSAPSSSGNTPKEPNYITFARLNQKANSMSITLFYGGAGMVLFGVLGLVFLLCLFLHNRRSRAYDGRDGIFEEIAEAEQRHPGPDPAPPPQPPVQPDPPPRRPPAPAPTQPPYYDPTPAQDNLYTEEFELPQPGPGPYDGYDSPTQDSLYTEEFDLPPQPPAPYPDYTAPSQDSLYTEEFDLPQRPPAHMAPPPPQQPAARNPYDTDEILRELLGKDK